MSVQCGSSLTFQLCDPQEKLHQIAATGRKKGYSTGSAFVLKAGLISELLVATVWGLH